MIRNAATILLAALVVSSGPLAGQSPDTAAPPPVASNPTLRDEVRVQPGDFIQVVIYREPELNGEFLVDADGMVVLPLIGERQVAGVGVRELRRSLAEAYRVHLRNPSINIIPLRRVTVLGEVNRPGMYNIDPTVSLAGAIAMAGGPSSTGNIERIRILREGRVIRERAAAGQTLVDADIRSNDLIFVERRGWFERNTTFVITALLTVTSLVSSIIINANR